MNDNNQINSNSNTGSTIASADDYHKQLLKKCMTIINKSNKNDNLLIITSSSYNSSSSGSGSIPNNVNGKNINATPPYKPQCTNDQIKLSPLYLPNITPSKYKKINNKNKDIIKPVTATATVTSPPKKKKKIATQKELEMVLEHYQIAINKNIEDILTKNEPHVIKYRDKVYNEAKQNGITHKSSDPIRLKVIGNVIEYTFMNVEPPNDYTKQTDRKHFKEVAAWAVKFCKNRNIPAPLTLIYSAWCHDIERFIPSTKCKYLPEAVDKYRKQVIHGITSAKVAGTLLKGAPVTQQEIDRIYDLILHHDIPTPRDDIIILSSLLIPAASDDLMWELELLMDADSFAFFQSTIYFFILFKSNGGNSPEWIWERVVNNVRRLRPYLRPKAVQCINKLPDDLLNKMSINQNVLKHLCSQSGLNSKAQSNMPSNDNSMYPSPNDNQKNTDNTGTVNGKDMAKLTINGLVSRDNDQDNCELVDMKI